MLNKLRLRLLALFFKSKVETELGEELRFHLEKEVEHNIARGMEPEDARLAALRSFGGVEQIRERCRDERRIYLWDAVWRDLRYGLRLLLKEPKFTATMIVTLAVGIGANIAIFSVVNTALLRPLTYPEADRIVLFLFTSAPGGANYGGSAAKFNVLRRQPRVFQNLSASEYGGKTINLTGGAYPEQVRAIRVSADYFRLFGAPVTIGHTFTADDDRLSGGQVVVLSYAFWQRRFGGDPRTISTRISLNDESYTVIGVLGPSFNAEFDSPPDIWLPFQIDPGSNDQSQYFNIVARLKPGVTIEQANAELQMTADEFRRVFPNVIGPADRFIVKPLQEAIVSEVRPSLLILIGAVSFVLLIACANVASLLLVRAAGRRREVALRVAIGAGPGHLIRQMLTESLLLSLTGGAFGLVLGFAGVRALLAINPSGIPRLGEHGSAVVIDWRICLFTVLISVITGILFGLAPAVNLARTDPGSALKESGGRPGTALRQNRILSLLVISEIALALMLLVGAGLLIRTFIALRAVDPGFDPHYVMTMVTSLTGSRFKTPSDINELTRDAARRLEGLPGIAHVGASYNLPLGMFGIPFNIVGRVPTNGRYDGRGWAAVSPGYFSVFKIPVMRGRAFSDRDSASGVPVAVINQALARQFWPQGDPVGELISLGKDYGPEFEEPPRQIIGVVGDVHNAGLNQNPAPAVYVPLAQVSSGVTKLLGRVTPLIWTIRTNAEPIPLIPNIEKELLDVSQGLPVGGVRSMGQVMSQATASTNFNTLLLTILGFSAMLLATVGIYGLMAYFVQQRTQEIGIRIAMGAQTRDVLKLIVGRGMLLAIVGISAGLIGAAFVTRLMAGWLFGVSAIDPLTFILIAFLLTGVALLACYFPARRATKIDPMIALRHD